MRISWLPDLAEPFLDRRSDKPGARQSSPARGLQAAARDRRRIQGRSHRSDRRRARDATAPAAPAAGEGRPGATDPARLADF